MHRFWMYTSSMYCGIVGVVCYCWFVLYYCTILVLMLLFVRSPGTVWLIRTILLWAVSCSPYHPAWMWRWRWWCRWSWRSNGGANYKFVPSQNFVMVVRFTIFRCCCCCSCCCYSCCCCRCCCSARHQRWFLMVPSRRWLWFLRHLLLCFASPSSLTSHTLCYCFRRKSTREHARGNKKKFNH